MAVEKMFKVGDKVFTKEHLLPGKIMDVISHGAERIVYLVQFLDISNSAVITRGIEQSQLMHQDKERREATPKPELKFHIGENVRAFGVNNITCDATVVGMPLENDAALQYLIRFNLPASTKEGINYLEVRFPQAMLETEEKKNKPPVQKDGKFFGAIPEEKPKALYRKGQYVKYSSQSTNAGITGFIQDIFNGLPGISGSSPGWWYDVVTADTKTTRTHERFLEPSTSDEFFKKPKCGDNCGCKKESKFQTTPGTKNIFEDIFGVDVNKIGEKIQSDLGPVAGMFTKMAADFLGEQKKK